MTNALYDSIGRGYARLRRPDPRIGAEIAASLGAARSVLNVGAGSGSYEPVGPSVVAVEPSEEMVRQRQPGAAPAVRAVAGALPFRDGSFDAALAILTIHHWPDRRRGLEEMRRVARDRVVLLTWDPEHPPFWLIRDYFPEILEIDRRIFPPRDELESVLGPVDIRPVPVPADCTDGFLGAYWRRPERYLDPRARSAISSFATMRDAGPGLERLRSDLSDGAWARRNASLLERTELDLGYRLVVAEGGSATR